MQTSSSAQNVGLLLHVHGFADVKISRAAVVTVDVKISSRRVPDIEAEWKFP